MIARVSLTWAAGSCVAALMTIACALAVVLVPRDGLVYPAKGREMGSKRKAAVKGTGKLRVVRPLEPETTKLADAITLLINLGFQELRELPDVTNLRAVDAPISPAHVRTLDQVAECINDLVICAANLVERDLSPEEARPYLEHVRAVYMRRFGLDPDSERHARAALVGLVKVAAESGFDVEPREEHSAREADAVRAWLEARTEWVLASYADDFAAYANKLDSPAKRVVLRGIIAAWRSNREGARSQTAIWELFGKLGRGVFRANDVKDWRDNVWRKLRHVVSVDDA